MTHVFIDIEKDLPPNARAAKLTVTPIGYNIILRSLALGEKTMIAMEVRHVAPLIALPSGPDDPDHKRLADVANIGARKRKLRILIVEDEAFVAMDIEAILEVAGHEVVGHAISANEAVRKAAQVAPDLILMDIRLSGTRDGIDAALEIRQHSDVALIFVTANVDAHTHARAMQAKPLAIAAKPFTAATLLAAVAQFRENH